MEHNYKQPETSDRGDDTNPYEDNQAARENDLLWKPKSMDKQQQDKKSFSQLLQEKQENNYRNKIGAVSPAKNFSCNQPNSTVASGGPLIIKKSKLKPNFQQSHDSQGRLQAGNNGSSVRSSDENSMCRNSQESNKEGNPSVSVVNYNKATFSMNPGESSIQNLNAYDNENEFYDALTYSKFNSGLSKANNVWGLSANQQPPTVIKKSKNVSSNPYADDLGKSLKNMNPPMSQQVSRQSSQTEIDSIDLNDEARKKKPTKKRIIKKIVKKKNADEVEAFPQKNDPTAQKEDSKMPQPGDPVPNKEEQSQQQDNNVKQEVSQQDQEEQLPKKKDKKIIIRKKKKQAEAGEQEDAQSQQQQQVKQQHLQSQHQIMAEEPSQASQTKQYKQIQQQKPLQESAKAVDEEVQDQFLIPQVTERKKNKRDATLRPQESSFAESDDEPNVRSNQKPIIENPYEEEEKNPGRKQRPKSVMRVDQRQQEEAKVRQRSPLKRPERSRATEEVSEEESDGESRNEAEGSSEDEEIMYKKDLLRKKRQLLQMQQQQQNETTQKAQTVGRQMSFRVAECDIESYNAFVYQLVFGNKARELIMSSIPFQVGQLRFTIERNRKGLSRLHPSFNLYLEKNTGGRVLILYAKKRPFKRTANYIISMDKNMKDRGSDSCVGKLRANPEGDKYILYDNGENFNKVHRYALDKIRNEHGAFVYRYEPCNVGNIRKMIIVLPILVQSSASHINGPENIYPIAYDPSGNKVVMTQKQWKPIRFQDTMLEVFHREGVRNTNYLVFVDNPPAWNPKTNTYVYDFKGRVTHPSIKNFQLIPEIDGRRGQTLQEFILQFGKNGQNSFILDVQYPFSIFQAFGLGLSAFDTD